MFHDEPYKHYCLPLNYFCTMLDYVCLKKVKAVEHTEWGGGVLNSPAFSPLLNLLFQKSFQIKS